MQNFNPDPNPVDYPLVLIGMIATTYTFINRVATQNDFEPVESEEVIEEISTEQVEETTTSTSTTTTIPEDVVKYLKKLQVKIQAIELGKKVLETNQRGMTKLIHIKKHNKSSKNLLMILPILLVFLQNPDHQLCSLI